MISIIISIGKFFQSIWKSLKDPEFRALFISVVVIILTGTIFYTLVEGWNLLDSLYFSVITLTTVGYGDLSPTVPASQVFTIFYILIGIGVLLAFINKLAINIPSTTKQKNINPPKTDENNQE